MFLVTDNLDSGLDRLQPGVADDLPVARPRDNAAKSRGPHQSVQTFTTRLPGANPAIKQNLCYKEPARQNCAVNNPGGNSYRLTGPTLRGMSGGFPFRSQNSVRISLDEAHPVVL